MVTQLVFLRETMTCNTMRHPLKENRKTTHVNAKQTLVRGVWGPGRKKSSFWMQITQQTQAKPSLTRLSPAFAHPMTWDLLEAKLYSLIHLWWCAERELLSGLKHYFTAPKTKQLSNCGMAATIPMCLQKIFIQCDRLSLGTPHYVAAYSGWPFG